MAGSRAAEPIGVAEPRFGDGLRLAVAGRRRRRHRMGRARRSERPVLLRPCAGGPSLLWGYPLGGPARPVVIATFVAHDLSDPGWFSFALETSSATPSPASAFNPREEFEEID